LEGGGGGKERDLGEEILVSFFVWVGVGGWSGLGWVGGWVYTCVYCEHYSDSYIFNYFIYPFIHTYTHTTHTQHAKDWARVDDRRDLRQMSHWFDPASLTQNREEAKKRQEEMNKRK
jgi:hypothetical protein